MRARLILPIVLLSVVNHFAAAQLVPTCGGAGPSAEIVAQALARGEQRDGMRYIKCHVVIAATYSIEGTYMQAATVERVQRDIDFTNDVYERSNTGIQLQVCAPFEVVVDPMLFSVTGDASSFFAQRWPGYLNIFYVGYMSAPVGGGAVLDMATVSPLGTVDVLAHEIGHILGLGHTDSGGALPGELVDGSNCTEAADHLCDTPADPGIYAPGLVIQSTCTYVGTITDANGDLYQPLLNNVMSGSPCLKDSLTPQQGAVMRYALDSLHVEFLTTVNPVVIDPFPLQLCANDPPLVLNATPGPGTWSGPFVQGDQLINFPNPPGDYFVTYTPDQEPDAGLFTIVDTYHVPNLYVSGFGTPHVADSVRQSFRAGRDGSFAQVDVRLMSPNQALRMRLYEGTGTTLTLLHDTSMFFFNTDTSWVHFQVPATVPCIAGTVYSYVVTADQPFASIAPWGGYIEWGTNNLSNLNMMFRTWVRTTVPCQESTRFYELYQVPDRPITNLASAYCHNDEQAIALIADVTGTTTTLFQIDGNATGTIMPATLGIGEHVASHIYTIEGCTDTLNQVFAVEGPVDFSYPGISPVICVSDDPVTLMSEPPAGAFYIDGMATDVLDPLALGAGTHTVVHVNAVALDTVVFADQVCCYTGYALNTFLHDDEVSWQGFIAEHSGELESIRIPLELFGIERQLVVELRSGQGMGGALLHEDTITATAHDGVLLSGTGVQVDAGSAYTWSIRKVNDGNESLPPMIGITWGDHYPEGFTAAPGTPDTTGDLRFQEYITQRYSCIDSMQIEVMVEVCEGVGEAIADAAWAGPNPFGDELVIRGGAERLRFVLLAADGRVVQEGSSMPGMRLALSTDALPAGCYFLRLWSGADPVGKALPLVHARD